MAKATNTGASVVPSPWVLLQSVEQMIAHADGVRHRSQSRIHRANAREEAGVDHSRIVQLMRLAVHVQYRRLRVFAEADCPCLMCHTANPNLILHVEIARDQMMWVHA